MAGKFPRDPAGADIQRCPPWPAHPKRPEGARRLPHRAAPGAFLLLEWLHSDMYEQADVIAFLSTPAAYGRPTATAIERIDTHISIVWLAGDLAYKLKRSVAYDYVDFSRLEARRVACEAEVRLNRRTAPSLYLAVRPVTREPDGALMLNGRGEPIEWLVEMRRFDQEVLFDRLAEGGTLDLELMDGLAGEIASLHAGAERRTDRGGRDGMAWVVDGNALAFTQQMTGDDRAMADRMSAAARAALHRHEARLDGRRRDGSVRWCHGDLHLRNIVLLDGTPTLFDSVEFNDQIACVDVLYDLAFLLMDLWHRGLRAHANAVFNGYMTRTMDLEGLPLLPLFLSCRAAVRAKTSATTGGLQSDESRAHEFRIAAREYLALAEALLQPSAPRLLAIGGLSGSGKSTLARRVAPLVGATPGALILRSDVIRKQQHGVSPLTPLDVHAYEPAATRRVYKTIADSACAALSSGHSVIADAVYRSADERRAIAAVARDAGAPFVGVWLDASPTVLASRLSARGVDASDATTDVLARQIEAGAGSIEWWVLDASPGTDIVGREAEELLRRLG